MSIFGWWRKSDGKGRRRPPPGSAAVARDRLTILLSHEGPVGANSDLLGLLRESIVAVVCRHVTIRPDQIQMSLHRGASVSTLAIEIEIPA